jgi:acyl-coenzyme A synthetase/AMP-(fatty) acid ligase
VGWKIARALAARPGLARNARVVVAKRNHPDYLLYLLSAIAAGGVPVAVNAATGWRYVAAVRRLTGAAAVVTDADTLLGRPDEDGALAQLLAAAEVEVLVVGRRFDEVVRRWPAARRLRHFHADVEAAPAEPPPPRRLGDDTPVAMFHTSGTTGVPKCCLWDRRNLLRIWRTMMLTLPAGPGSRCMLAPPFSHALYFALQPGLFLCGVPTYARAEFEPRACLDAIDRLGITHFLGFPYVYMRLAAEDLSRWSLASMRVWSTGADKVHAAHIAPLVRRGAVRWGRHRGSVFLDSYGSTEIGAGGIVQLWFPGSRPEPCVQGKPLPTQFAFRIVDAGWNDLPRGEAGRILVRSSTHFAGYWNNHDTWADGRIDGWWWAGDVGRVDARGRLVFLDREVDLVRGVDGVVHTLPVEEELLADPRVMEAAVFQRTTDPAAGTGEAVAWVVPRRWLEREEPPPVDLARLERDLAARAEERLGVRLSAVRALPLAELPLGVTGKVLKRRLRELVLAPGREAPAPWPERRAAG